MERDKRFRRSFAFYFLFLLSFIFPLGAFCSDAKEDSLSLSVMKLLEGYIKNDLTVQSLVAQVRIAELESKSVSIANGIQFSLESGTLVYVGGETNTLSFSPSASVSLPQVNGVSVSLSSDIQISQSALTAEDTSLSVSADIISSASKTREISLMESQRSVLVAKRELQNRLLSAEEEFYTQLKSLYSTAVSIISKEKDLYEDELAFSEILASGYSKSSSKYRLAQMEVVSDEHEIQKLRRELESDVRVFAKKCGLDYQVNIEESGLDFLPSDVPLVEAVDVLSFDPSSYADTESAVWTNNINTLSRDAQSFFSLSASAGYTFNNSNTQTDTIDLGTGIKLSDTGLVMSAGVSLPTDFSSAPAYTLSFSVDPSAFLQSSITKEVNGLEEQKESIAIESAWNDYYTAVLSQQTSLEDILWNRNVNKESYEMYSELEVDMKKYFSQGFVTESEYREAFANKENYRIQCIINDIELIIYNDQTKLLFCRDEEI